MIGKALRAMLAVLGLAAIVALPSAAKKPGGTSFHGKLTAVVGEGAGSVQGTTTSEDHGTLAVQGTVGVHQTSPNTLFEAERLLDPVPDGDCADPGPPPVTLTTFTTSNGGARASHFELHTPAPSGTTFDIRFRVSGADGTVLETDCLVVTVK